VEKMKKEKDIQTLKKVASLLKEAFRRITYDIENIDEVFNSEEALEIIDKYSSITISLDEMLYDLFCYFEDLALVYEEKQEMEV
jgi:hypothetical protein